MLKTLLLIRSDSEVNIILMHQKAFDFNEIYKFWSFQNYHTPRRRR